MPPATNHQRPSSPAPDETAPHMNAHIGANHVIGLKSSSTADGAGKVRTDAKGIELAIA
jgi:hypothetical protein